ncbi:MAG: ATP-binding protein, partial [bacterium]|nr:ATP-binding protein [bacterium]
GMPMGINLLTEREGIAVRLGGAVFIVHPNLHNTAYTDVSPPSLTRTINDQSSTVKSVSQREISTPATYFPPVHSTREAIKSAKRETQLAPRREGKCTYMIIDPNLLLKDPNDAPHVKRVFQTISGLAQSQDFYITSDNRGNVVVIALTQRAGGSLARWANATFDSTGQRANILLGNGELRKSTNSLVINGYPNIEELDNIREIGSNKREIRVRNSDFHSLSSGRDSTLFQFRSRRDQQNPDFLQIRITPEIQLKVGGGPDRLIGYEQELEDLREATSSSSETRLSILKGNAGTGKSRLLHELVSRNPSSIVLSLDPAGQHIQGDALVTVANQLAKTLKSKLSTNEKRSSQIAPLLEFYDNGEIYKLAKAQKDPDDVVTICLNALKAYESKEGGFTLVLDDVHHTDRHSDIHLMKLINSFLDQSSGKAILAMRPEERFHSKVQMALESTIQSIFTNKSGRGKYVKHISLIDNDGKPKLDLSDTQTAHDYVFYSLPEERRTNPDNGEPRSLGDWPKQLGEIANTAFEFTTYINAILEKPDLYLIVGKEQIDLQPEALTRIKDISGDLTIYHTERVATDLSPGSRKLLECIALVGDKVPIGKLLGFTRKILPGTITKELEELTEKGFLIDKGEARYRFWHETIRDAVLSGMDSKSRKELALQLHDAFKGEERLSHDNRLALLQHAAGSQQEDETRYWTTYGSTANEALEDATTKGTYGKGFGLAMTILDDLNPDVPSTVTRAIEKMKKGAKTSEEIKNFIVRALVSTVYNGVYLGRTQKAYEAIEALEKIATHRPGSVNFKMIYLLGFEAAYITTDLEKLEEFELKLKEKTDLKTSNPKKQLLIDLKFAYKIAAAKTHNFAECQKVCEENPEIMQSFSEDPNSDDSTEIRRLIYRIRLEQSKVNLAKNGVDEDVITDPSLLSQAQSNELFALLENLAPQEEKRRRDPSSFRPIDELFLLDQVAQTKSHLGHWDAACDDFKEIWRIAMQMEIYTQAARAAKLRGDMEVMQGLSQIKGSTKDQKGYVIPFPNGIILRKKILQAINTYTEEGLSALKNVDENNQYNFILRIQRIRAIGILALSYENEIKVAKSSNPTDTEHLARIQSELAPHIATAMEDLSVLEEEPWKQAAQGNGEAPYYVSPYANIIVNCADQLEIESIPEEDRSTSLYLSPEAIQKGLEYFDSKTMHDNIGESLRKARSLINASLRQSIV